MFRAADLNDHVAVARVLADDLPAVDPHARAEEERGALLQRLDRVRGGVAHFLGHERPAVARSQLAAIRTVLEEGVEQQPGDRKSTRLNSSHLVISYAVFCLKKKT